MLIIPICAFLAPHELIEAGRPKSFERIPIPEIPPPSAMPEGTRALRSYDVEEPGRALHELEKSLNNPTRAHPRQKGPSTSSSIAPPSPATEPLPARIHLVHFRNEIPGHLKGIGTADAEALIDDVEMYFVGTGRIDKPVTKGYVARSLYNKNISYQRWITSQLKRGVARPLLSYQAYKARAKDEVIGDINWEFWFRVLDAPGGYEHLKAWVAKTYLRLPLRDIFSALAHEPNGERLILAISLRRAGCSNLDIAMITKSSVDRVSQMFSRQIRPMLLKHGFRKQTEDVLAKPTPIEVFLGIIGAVVGAWLLGDREDSCIGNHENMACPDMLHPWEVWDG